MGLSSSRYSLAEKAALVVVLASLLVLVVFPLAALIYGSLQTDSLVSPNREWTIEKIKAIYFTTDYIKPILNTFYIAAPATILSVVIGVTLAWLFTRTNLMHKDILSILIISPLLLSPFVGAVAWLSLLGPETGFLNVAFRAITGSILFDIFSLPGVVWVMAIYFVPYAYLFTAASINSMDPALEDASRISGAGVLSTLLRITFPLSRPSILSASIFIFVLACEMFSIPAILGLPKGYTNLAYFIYRNTRRTPPDWPLAAASGTLLLILAIIGTWLYQRYTQKTKMFTTITGKGYRPRIVDLGRWRGLITGCVWLYAITTVILPQLALLVGSFLKYNTIHITRETLTLEHYTRWLKGDWFFLALWNTLKLSFFTPIAVMLLAIAIGYIVIRTDLPIRRLLDGLASLPVAIPGIVLGVALIWAYFKVPLPIYGTIGIMLIGYVARYLPHGVRTISTTLIQIGNELEEAGRVNGATPAQVLRTVTVPLLKPSLLYIWMLVFMLVSREVSAAVLLYVPESITLSVLIWDIINASGNINSAYSLGVIQTIFILLLVVVARVAFGVDLVNRTSREA